MFDGQMAEIELPQLRRRPRRGMMLLAGARAAWRRWKSRRAIVGLDARALKDIGVSYAEAEAEANKPFWQA